MMPMQVKYAMVDRIFPVLFSAAIQHRQMAELGRITSAGFVRIEGGRVHCFGESVSLKMGVDPEDEEIIAQFLRL